MPLLVTPPVGMNLFVLQDIGMPMRTIALGALPFLLAMFALLRLMPDVALWLTRHLK